MEKCNGVWSNWNPTWSLNFCRNICTPLSLTLQSMSINKSRLMCSLKCFAFLWKVGREGEDEGFLYGKMHVGQICYPIPDETGLLNFCLFCSAAKSTAEVIHFIVSFNVRLRPTFARRDHRHRPRWLVLACTPLTTCGRHPVSLQRPGWWAIFGKLCNRNN
jgi:hypothetical protein